MQTSTNNFCVKFGRPCDCLVECTVAEDTYEREFVKKTKDKAAQRQKWGEKPAVEHDRKKEQKRALRRLKDEVKCGD